MSVNLLDPTLTTNGRSDIVSRLSGDLIDLYRSAVTGTAPPASATLGVMKVVQSDGQAPPLVVVDALAVAGQGDALLRAMQGAGLQNGAVFGDTVSGLLPITALDALADLEPLKSVTPSYSLTRAGAVDGQGDAAMTADSARAAFGVDGTGVKVGVLSDSFDVLGGAASDIANGDLPADIEILSDAEGNGEIDEGRAMLQIVHDIAPGADLAFHDVEGGIAAFAQAIVTLANAGAQVIVDDVGYYETPFFQDGEAAQAVDQVYDGGNGVAYFSSAGNNADQSWEGAFVDSGQTMPNVGPLHDFDPSANVDPTQSVTIPNGDYIQLVFQWTDPVNNVQSDLDIYLTDDTGTPVAMGATDNALSGKPGEYLFYFNDTGSDVTLDLVIALYSGPTPTHMKYIEFGGVQINEYATNTHLEQWAPDIT